ncbi:H-NS histone family protein [Burkholderia contaminans]|nr:H-NS histone family protein [Burkholderia contaminans]
MKSRSVFGDCVNGTIDLDSTFKGMLAACPDGTIAAIVDLDQFTKYGITSERLFGRRDAVATNTSAPVAPKYRAPKTGVTWSGRGRAFNGLREPRTAIVL